MRAQRCLSLVLLLCAGLRNSAGNAPPPPRACSVRTLAGSGAAAWADGVGTAASFLDLQAVSCCDTEGGLRVLDAGRPRRVSHGGEVSSLPPDSAAWTAGPAAGAGLELLRGGAGTSARIAQGAPAAAFPSATVAVDAAGRLYVSDAAGRVVRVLEQSGSGRGEAQPPPRAASEARSRGWVELIAESVSVSDTVPTHSAGAEPESVSLRALPFAAAAAPASGDGGEERLWVLDSGRVRLITCDSSPHSIPRRAALQLSSPPPPPPPPLPPLPPPPPPDFYVAGLNGLTNLAFDKQVQVSSSGSPNPAQAVGYLSDAPLSGDYVGRCGVAAGGSFVSNGGDTIPYYQVDLGGPAAVTDVQVWATQGFADWLSPLSVFVSNFSTFRNGSNAFGTPCYVFDAADAAGQPYSLQHACPGQGRYVTLALLSPLDAHPTSLILRFCALMVFGEYSPPPPPPPFAPPAPNAPYVPFQWWVVLIILIFTTAIAAIVLGSVVRLRVLARAKTAEKVLAAQLAKYDAKLTEAVKSAHREAVRDDEYIRTRVNLWPTSPRQKRSEVVLDTSVFPVLGAELNNLQQSGKDGGKAVELTSRHVRDGFDGGLYDM